MTTPQTAPAAAGEVFAAGHAESGNDLPVLLSTCKAERVDGGYRFTGGWTRAPGGGEASAARLRPRPPREVRSLSPAGDRLIRATLGRIGS